MTENNTKIAIAVIGLVGILGGAFFANWDKIFPSPAPTEPEPPTHPENGGSKSYTPRDPEPEPPPKVPNDFAQSIDELQMELENIEHEHMKAHEEIEQLRQFLETDKDAQQAIENKERWLEQLEMDRSNVQREIDHLREQR